VGVDQALSLDAYDADAEAIYELNYDIEAMIGIYTLIKYIRLR
jgi:hypothetical protein